MPVGTRTVWVASLRMSRRGLNSTPSPSSLRWPDLDSSSTCRTERSMVRFSSASPAQVLTLAMTARLAS